ncbi:MBL fold metallo-hydrolase [Aromatoleum sp.]|uniref:MBL fold metallo-hydrolase n=1 Tax=Aromatoleum sp. TaxID=2307007 RepID=UPI002FCA2C46
MAKSIKRNPDSAPGEWYIDTRCIDCAASRDVAPGLIVERNGLSIFARQPASEEEQTAAWRAALLCPTASIRREHPQAPPEGLFPQALAAGVFRCGFNARSSFGAHSYLVLRPEGNLLVDSPRFAPQLLKRFEEWGGIGDILLSHQDDVADAGRYADRYSSRVWIHADDADDVPYATHLIRGEAPVTIREGLVAVPLPGHTKGSVAYLLEDTYLFTGDSLAWNPERQRLIAYRDACWYSWDVQKESMKRLLDYDFEWVLPGHGGHVQLPRAEMHQKLAELLVRM